MITQRESDIMELESELRVRRIFEEWQRGFLRGRLPEIQPGLEGEVPIAQDVIDNSGAKYQ